MNCYLCHGSTNAFMKKNGYWIYVCPSCGLGMTDLRMPYAQFVKEHYAKGYFTGDPRYSAYENYEEDKTLIRRNFQKYFEKILQHISYGKLLDVGCALGYGVQMGIEMGFDSYGFDPSSYATSRAKTLVGSDHIQTGTIQDVSYPKKTFAAITLFDVFEHLEDPRKDLRKLREMLTKEGILVIATGDTQSILAKILKRRWTFYIPPQHLFFFSKKTLTTLLREAGFEPIDWFRIGKWLSLRYILHLARTSGESRLGDILYHALGKTILGKLSLFLPVGDNMVVIARKRYAKRKIF